MNIVPREQWTAGLRPCGGLPPAWTSTSTPRPALLLPLALLIVHYTGAKAKYVGQTADKLLAQLRALYVGVFTGITVPEAKGDEYNFVIDPFGTVYEWAGLKRAAHCSGKNTTSIGVLLLLGVGEMPTLEMVNALLELRQHLASEGALVEVHAVDQHGEHFSTPCPGDAVKARWPMFDLPLPAPTPQLPVNQEDPVATFVRVTDHPDHPGIDVLFERLPGGRQYLHVDEPQARLEAAIRTGGDFVAWVKSQPLFPGGYKALFDGRFVPRA